MKRLSVAVLPLMLLVLVGCGGGSDSSSSATTTTPFIPPKGPGTTVASSSDCATFKGANPTPAEFQAMRTESFEASVAIQEQYGLGGGDTSGPAATQATTGGSQFINPALEQAPAGSVQKFTEYVCDVTESQPDVASQLFAPQVGIGALRNNPNFADVDFDAVEEAVGDLRAEYPATSAVPVLQLCGTSITAGSSITTAVQQNYGASTPVGKVLLQSAKILCPSQV